jgi:hypothetical protein
MAGEYAVLAMVRRLAERVGSLSPEQEAVTLDAIEQLLTWLDDAEAAL